MRISILRVAKGNVSWSDKGSQEYLKRIASGWRIEEQKLPLSQKGEVWQRQLAETEQIQKLLQPDDRLIVLDERGEQITSEEFAQWLNQSMEDRVKRVVFAIGGPFGHAPELRQQAWKVLGFSPMVLNHEMVRLLLSEQLYRASTIIWGGSYHH